MKRLALLFILLFACVTTLAWTPLSLQRIETEKIKILSDTGKVKPKEVEIVTPVALRRMVFQVENAFKEDRNHQDSVAQQFGIAQCNSAGTDTITLDWSYEDTTYAILVMGREPNSGGIFPSGWPLSESTFAVQFYTEYEYTFQWFTIGRK